MRPREPALLNRLKEIVDIVNDEFPGLPVVANGDCWGVEDRDRICELTGEFFLFLFLYPLPPFFLDVDHPFYLYRHSFYPHRHSF